MNINLYKMGYLKNWKVNLIKNSLFLLNIILLSNSMVFANPVYDETKTINKSFKISKTGTLEVSNRHGNVTIETWDKEEVSFQINIVVSSSSQSKTKEAIDNVSITFASTSQEVSAVTEIENNNSSSWFSWFGNNNVSHKIHYTIKCPKTLTANITNKYGNIKLPDWSGNTTVNLSYGNIYANNLAGKNKLFLNYGKLNIIRADDFYTVMKYSDGSLNISKNLEVQLSYSDINIEEVAVLTGSTKYSELYIENISTSATLKTAYDEYFFNKVSSLSVSGNYTEVSIKNLVGNFETQTSYGGVNIKNVEPSVKSIKFDGKYTDLTIKGLTNYNLNFDGRYASPRLPSTFKYSLKDKEGSSFKCEGQDGSGKTNVKVVTSYGDLSIY